MGEQDRVYIFDTTLRDGEQSPGASMTFQEKILMARKLEELGVDCIEAGFPIASEGDFEAVSKIAKEVKDPIIVGLARTNRADIEQAARALEGAKRPRVHVFIATSPIHRKAKLKKDKAQVLDAIASAVTLAKSYVDDVEFSAEDATRTEWDFLRETFQCAIVSGANVINVPDTVGYSVPEEYRSLIAYLKSNIPEAGSVLVSTHCHDDLGLAVSNSLAGILGGARQVEGALLGIGERAGNASIEEVIMAIKMRGDTLPFFTKVNSSQIYPACKLLSQITGIPIPINKSVVGANAFAHEAGIHQDGVLKDVLTYEIMNPADIGIPGNALILGKHSGRHAFKNKIEGMGFRLAEDELERVFKRFKALADEKKQVFDEDIETLVTEELRRGDQKGVEEAFVLKYLQVTSGSMSIPTATVTMAIRGEECREAGFGDGMVDATYKTIARMVGTNSELVRYQVNAITGGTDAQGVVNVTLKEGSSTVTGKGAHTDIIMASALAYINALNRLELVKARKASLEMNP